MKISFNSILYDKFDSIELYQFAYDNNINYLKEKIYNNNKNINIDLGLLKIDMKKDIKLNQDLSYETQNIGNIGELLDFFSNIIGIGCLFEVLSFMSIFIGTIYVIYESGEINSKLFFYGVYFTLTFLSEET